MGSEYRDISLLVEKEFRAVEEAKGLMVKGNLRLVISLAKNHTRNNSTMSLADLIQEGNFGLIRAVYRFDPGFNNKFGTYATWWIRQSFQRACLDKSRHIRWPSHIHYSVARIKRFKKDANGENNLTDFEIAAKLGVNPKIVRLAQQSDEHPMSLEGSFDANDETKSLVSCIPDETIASPFEQVGQKELEHAISAVLDRLPERSAKIIRMRFGIDHPHSYTLEEVGNVMGVSRERVRQIEKDVLVSMRKPYNRHRLEGFVDA